MTDRTRVRLALAATLGGLLALGAVAVLWRMVDEPWVLIPQEGT